MTSPSVLFVLPVGGGGGGAHSVVQETGGLVRLGLRSEIAVDKANYHNFLKTYPELQSLRVFVREFDGASQLGELLSQFSIAVATTNNSIFEVHSALKHLAGKDGKSPRVAYYVQDYEPLFYAPNSKAWKVAYGSYTVIPDATLFAKTDWIRNVVYDNHGVRVAKVNASIDHGVYYPDARLQRVGLSFAAMLRPQTPRRAPKRTLRILETLARELGEKATIRVFGVRSATLEASGLSLSPQIENRGVLRRQEVAELLRPTDMFLDLSDYQAFGRTGLESMACGCVPIVPLFGGTNEYAVHGHNAYVVDTRSDDAILEAARHFASLSDEERGRMRLNALETAANFTIEKASLSMMRLFENIASSAAH